MNRPTRRRRTGRRREPGHRSRSRVRRKPKKRPRRERRPARRCCRTASEWPKRKRKTIGVLDHTLHTALRSRSTLKIGFFYFSYQRRPRKGGRTRCQWCYRRPGRLNRFPQLTEQAFNLIDLISLCKDKLSRMMQPER